jgi:glyceraldehyde-3-phosphate dehydrogenase (NADP+)
VAAGVEKLRVGPPEDDCDITPVVSESSANFIEGLVEDARAKGAKFLTPYRRWAAGRAPWLGLAGC